VNRVLLGVLGGFVLVAVGIFWWQGRGDSEVARTARLALSGPPAIPDELPSADP
jgi:heme A synthase